MLQKIVRGIKRRAVISLSIIEINLPSFKLIHVFINIYVLSRELHPILLDPHKTTVTISYVIKFEHVELGNLAFFLFLHQ